VFFALLGSLVLLSSLTGPGSVQWTGTTVRGTESGGIVYWTYEGQTHSLDHTSRFASTTVAFDPRHPYTSAMLEYPVERRFDEIGVLAPFVIALGIAGSAVSRSRRDERNRLVGRASSQFGYGIDPLEVRRIIEMRRQAGR
jgi:hypothetical protein